MSGFSNILGNHRGSGFGGDNRIVYDDDAQLVFDEWDTPVDVGIKEIYNDFIEGCKADVSLRGSTSNWQEIVALWILMGPTRQISYLNVRHPSLTPITDVVAPNHIPNIGLEGNGSTQYVNLNWNPVTAVDTFTQNDSGIFLYGETDVAENKVALGNSNASSHGSAINPRTSTDIMQGRSSGVNTNIGSGGTTTSSLGFKGIRRINSTQIIVNKGLVTDSFTSTSASQPLVNLSLFGCNNNANGIPGATTYDSRRYSFWGVTRGYIDFYKLSLRIETFRS